MTEQTHTPGPWRVSEPIVWSERIANIIGADGSWVAKIENPNGKQSINEAKANAHLISAATDMFEALQEVLDIEKLSPTSTADHAAICLRIDVNIERIRLALAKARGES